MPFGHRTRLVDDGSRHRGIPTTIDSLAYFRITRARREIDTTASNTSRVYKLTEAVSEMTNVSLPGQILGVKIKSPRGVAL